MTDVQAAVPEAPKKQRARHIRKPRPAEVTFLGAHNQAAFDSYQVALNTRLLDDETMVKVNHDLSMLYEAMFRSPVRVVVNLPLGQDTTLTWKQAGVRWNLYIREGEHETTTHAAAPTNKYIAYTKIPEFLALAAQTRGNGTPNH